VQRSCGIANGDLLGESAARSRKKSVEKPQRPGDIRQGSREVIGDKKDSQRESLSQLAVAVQSASD